MLYRGTGRFLEPAEDVRREDDAMSSAGEEERSRLPPFNATWWATRCPLPAESSGLNWVKSSSSTDDDFCVEVATVWR